jgi:heptosyltransferase-3
LTSALYAFTSGARYTAGFLTPGQNRSRGYDRTVEHRNDRHEMENFAALLHGSGLGTEMPSHAPTVQVGEIDAMPFASEHALVVFHAWASGQRSWLREWPQERWIALAQELAQDRTLFVITGAPADAPRIGLLVDALRSAGLRAEGFVSPDGFRSLIHLLQRAKLVISVNTGVMHLAAVAGARVIGLSGPTSDLRWGPRGPYAIGIQASGGDCGYLNLGFEFDGHATDCMERISVDQVLLAALKLQTADLEVC